ncbi:MAG TPA: histidine phosphatase family protein [Acidimicrobiales bacterium]|nr:histidine phosphatase family protein [Acidimicrobiales bacterium]
MSHPRQRCLLIRHGETEWSLYGRHTGRTDLPMLPVGEGQARALRPEVAAESLSLVLTSPLRRARETCELAGLRPEPVVEADLLEWDYGSFEGRTTVDIRKERPGWSLFDDGAPGGESAAEVGTRVDRVIARVRAEPGDVACVAHAHVLRVLAARWLGLEPTAGRYFVLGPASISVLGWERQQPVVLQWNRC